MQKAWNGLSTVALQTDGSLGYKTKLFEQPALAVASGSRRGCVEHNECFANYPFFFLGSPVSAFTSSMVVRRVPPVSVAFTPGGRSQGMSLSGWPAVTS